MLLPPTVLGFCVEQYLLTAQKPCHLVKSVCAWVAITLGGCKLSKGNERLQPEHKCPGGAPLTPELGANHPHMVATLFNALFNPWTPTRLQPSPQNPNPTPKGSQMVAVTRLGRHGNLHHTNRVPLNITDNHPNCSHGGNQTAGANQGGSAQ